MELSVRSTILRGSVGGLLAERARSDGERLYCTHGGHRVSFAELRDTVHQVAEALAGRGVGPGSRVMLGLPNSVGHACLIFALLELDALWVPLNTRLRGVPLEHVLRDCQPTHVVVPGDDDLAAEVRRALAVVRPGPVGEQSCLPLGRSSESPLLVTPSPSGQVPNVAPSTRALLYTSGTTGPAKGVQVTERMLLASALGCVEAAGPVPGDCMYLWEPMYHIGGAQVLLLPLLADVRIALSSGFSASRFWLDVAASGATHIHYLGGILQMLLAQPPSPDQREHRARVGWGAGATPAVWQECERRFGITLRECYGMTETSSVVTVNRDGPEFGTGLPLPWFDVRLDQRTGGADSTGEILVRPTIDGLITPGYLNNETATRDCQEDGWWRTGDIGRLGASGHLHFAGRGNDSVRHRGENVSAWEVESVFTGHPDVAQCAVVGVTADVGEQEIKLFVSPVADRTVDPHELMGWARDRLADFQLPRYVSVLPELPLTPSRRVAKADLSKDVTDAVDTRRSRVRPDPEAET